MSRLKSILLVLIASMPLWSLAQSRFSCICESQKGQFYGAENLNACFHAIDVVDTIIFPKKIVAKDQPAAKILNPVYRFSKLFLTNYVFSDFIMTMNHERFGHGYRALAAGGEILNINYNPPPPFGNEFSFISLSGLENATDQERILMTLGGSEANMVLSDMMRKNMLLDGVFDYNFALAYLYGSNDMPGYTAFVQNPFSDPNTYRREINEFYYQRESLTKDRMRAISLFALLTDPMNFYAFKSVFYDYLFFGRRATPIKFIPVTRDIKLLPRFRFEYTPYGPELVYQSFFKLEEQLFKVSFSHGDGTFYSSWRVSANAWNVKASNKLSFDVLSELWNQPQIDFYENGFLKGEKGLGGLLVLTGNYDFITDVRPYSILGLTAQAGYKTAGYSLGQQLNSGILFRAGLSIKLE